MLTLFSKGSRDSKDETNLKGFEDLLDSRFQSNSWPRIEIEEKNHIVERKLFLRYKVLSNFDLREFDYE